MIGDQSPRLGTSGEDSGQMDYRDVETCLRGLLHTRSQSDFLLRTFTCHFLVDEDQYILEDREKYIHTICDLFNERAMETAVIWQSPMVNDITSFVKGGYLSNSMPSLRVKKIIGDIRECQIPMAQCISGDAEMSKGLAKQLCLSCPGLKEKIQSTQNREIGTIIEFQRQDFPFKKLQEYTGGLPLGHKEKSRSIFNLVTKDHFQGKPTYRDFEMTIQNLVHKLRERQIEEIAIPQLGCGLDKLAWERVEEILIKHFNHTEIMITIFYLKPQSKTEPPLERKRKVIGKSVNVDGVQNKNGTTTL